MESKLGRTCGPADVTYREKWNAGRSTHIKNSGVNPAFRRLRVAGFFNGPGEFIHFKLESAAAL
jgi:hypothetical protein